MRAGYAVDVRVAVVADVSAGCLHGRDREAVVFSIRMRTCVVSPVASTRPSSMREGSDAGQEVAAVLGVRDLGAIRPDLQEQVVHVGVGTLWTDG